MGDGSTTWIGIVLFDGGRARLGKHVGGPGGLGGELVDLALHLVKRPHSAERARELRRYIQYDPDPPV